MTNTQPFTPDKLLAYLSNLGFACQTHYHPPAHTVDENKEYRGNLPGAHVKNLFLKDKKAQLWLVVALEDRALDLKKIKKQIGAAHLSFGKSDLLQDVLGIKPGHVSPLALINDLDRKVTLCLDKGLFDHQLFNFHPLSNEATTVMSQKDFMTFVQGMGYRPIIFDPLQDPS